MTKGTLACIVIVLSLGYVQAQELTPSAWRERDQSPRIERIRKSLASGDTPNTDAFWSEIKAKGTPLIEPLGDKHSLVTFLWRGTPDTRNVVVFLSDFVGVRPQDYMMRRLGNSDVWFLTVRLPPTARFLYWLSPNNPLDSAFHGGLLGSSRQLDPLNLNPFFGIGSIAELPGAPAQPWIVENPNVPAGAVSDAQTISSKLLMQDRRVWVYTPPGYHRNGSPSDLIVLFDGRMYIDRLLAPITLNNLIAVKRIAPAVAVFIENPFSIRNEELFWNSTYADFVATELIPWIRTNFNVTKDSRRVVIGGASGGGAGATYAALRHSEVFGNVLSQSAGFAFSPERMQLWAERRPGASDGDRHIAEEIEDRPIAEGGWLAKLFIQAPKLPIRFYMDVGAFEADFMGGGLGALEPNRHMRDVLLAKGYEVHYQQFIGGHDYVNWRGTFADGVMALLGKK
jgi:enterochelin esterase family protein